MSQPSYFDFVHTWPDAIHVEYRRAHGREPALSDIMHGVWGVLYEGHLVPGPTPPEPPIAPAPDLGITGTSFYDEHTGLLWPWRGCSAFKLFQRWLEGEAEPLADLVPWARTNQINILRVFGMYDGGIGRLIPTDYYHYWSGLDAFFAALGNSGLACEFTIFADCIGGGVLPEMNFTRHYRNVRDIAQGHKHVVLEVCNEPFKNFPGGAQGIAALSVHDPRISQALGCYDVNLPTGRLDRLDYCTVHTPRDGEWPRKGKDLYELGRAGWPADPEKDIAAFKGLGIPCIGDEPFGIGRVVPGGSPSRSLVASDHAQYHAVCALMGAGSTIHGSFGIEARLPDAEEQACCDAVTASWGIIPTGVHVDWHYTAGHIGDCPLDNNGLRTYGMIAPDGQTAWVVRVRPTAPAVARPGWRIVSEQGFEGCIVQCARV